MFALSLRSATITPFARPVGCPRKVHLASWPRRSWNVGRSASQSIDCRSLYTASLFNPECCADFFVVRSTQVQAACGLASSHGGVDA